MEIACGLVGHWEIVSVHVVMRQRPTYAEWLRYRQWAEVSGRTLTCDASGFSIRPRTPGSAENAVLLVAPDCWRWLGVRGMWRAASSEVSAQSVQPSILASRVSPALDWLSAHGQTWRAELAAMREGTR